MLPGAGPPPTIGSGAGDCAPAPSHTTGHTVFSIRRLESRVQTFFLVFVASLPCNTTSWAGTGLHPASLDVVPSLGSSQVLLVASMRDSPYVCTDSFSPSLHRHYPASSLLWLLLTSHSLSAVRSPRVRCVIFPPAPSGSTPHVLMAFGFRCCSPANRPCQASLPVRVPTVEGLPYASFSFTSRLRLALG